MNSLTISDQAMQLLLEQQGKDFKRSQNPDGTWILPLDESDASHAELVTTLHQLRRKDETLGQALERVLLTTMRGPRDGASRRL